MKSAHNNSHITSSWFPPWNNFFGKSESTIENVVNLPSLYSFHSKTDELNYHYEKNHMYTFYKDHKFTNTKTLNQEEPIDELDKDMSLHIRWAFLFRKSHMFTF